MGTIFLNVRGVRRWRRYQYIQLLVIKYMWMFDKQYICEPIKLPQSPQVHLLLCICALLYWYQKARNLHTYNKQILQFKTGLKIRKMNLVNNQAGHEPTVCQQFEHVTCATRVKLQLLSKTQNCTSYLLLDFDTLIHYFPMYVSHKHEKFKT